MIVLLGKNERIIDVSSDPHAFESSNTRLLADLRHVVQQTSDGGTHTAQLHDCGRTAEEDGLAEHELRWKGKSYEIALDGKVWTFDLPEPISLGKGLI